jgi:hypothetical protein
MAEHVGIRMAEQTLDERDLHTPQDKLSVDDKSVDVIADAEPHG